MMERFLLFVGEEYYPHGGWDDLAASYDSLDAAKVAFLSPGKWWDGVGWSCWAHVVDLQTGAIASRMQPEGDCWEDTPQPPLE